MDTMKMQHRVYGVSEATCEALIGRQEAFNAIEAVFAAMANDEANNFTVVREAIGHSDALYGFKSGFNRRDKTLGLKAGGYWPHNSTKGLTNHQSSVMLFDADTGRLNAVVAGNYLTAVRTAASAAVSIAHLARADAKVLGMVGAGHQSAFQLRAALEQRDFEKVIAWNLHPEYLKRLEDICQAQNIAFESVSLQQLAQLSDVIITITSAFEPLLLKDWITAGTHIACMGTDTVGKQEIDPQILSSAIVFSDEVAQSILLGEAQHAITEKLINASDITPIGDVINGTHCGRTDHSQITIFDGTGVGLQDLAVASAALSLAIINNKTSTLDL